MSPLIDYHLVWRGRQVGTASHLYFEHLGKQAGQSPDQVHPKNGMELRGLTITDPEFHRWVSMGAVAVNSSARTRSKIHDELLIEHYSPANVCIGMVRFQHCVPTALYIEKQPQPPGTTPTHCLRIEAGVRQTPPANSKLPDNRLTPRKNTPSRASHPS